MCPFLYRYSEAMFTYACGCFWPFPLLIQFNTHPFVWMKFKKEPKTSKDTFLILIIENNARLVIIDPIQAYLGADVDMNRANEVRPIFMRLGQVAQRTGCAILLIGHLNKAAGMQSLQRGLGSIDIAAAVRSVMFIGKLKHDPTMRILTHEKSSLAPPGVSLAFSLGDEGGFRWVGEYDITADEMLSGIEPQRETKTQQAKDLICTLLARGKQVLSEDIDKAALERGIPGRTVRDAKRELGDALKSKIVEGRKKVFWME